MPVSYCNSSDFINPAKKKPQPSKLLMSLLNPKPVKRKKK